MEIMDIIKDAFVFPSQNLEKLVIYIVLTFVMGLLFVGGAVSGIFAVANNSIYFVITAILAIIAICIAFIISGYQIGIIKTGIDQVEDAPGFDWKNDLITGIKALIVSIVYFIIPAIIIAIVALVTNIPGQIMDIVQQAAVSPANTTAVASGATPIATISDAAAMSLFSSIAITGIVALILIIIFAFLATMANARLANTSSLSEAVNVVEAFKDITRIGVGKVIAVILLSIIIVAVIQGILGYLYGRVPQLSIISVIVTPYWTFFTNRVSGLLYSDIA